MSESPKPRLKFDWPFFFGRMGFGGAFFLICGLVAACQELRYESLADHGVRVPGIVTKLKNEQKTTPGREPEDRWFVYFTFQTEDGRQIKDRQRLTHAEYITLKVGQHVTVRYLPSAPSVHEVLPFSLDFHKTTRGRWIGIWLLLTIGVAGVYGGWRWAWRPKS